MHELFECPWCKSASYNLSWIRNRECCKFIAGREQQPNPMDYPDTPEGESE